MTAAPSPRCYDLLGTTFQVQSPSRDVTSTIEGLLAPFSCPSRPVPGSRRFRVAVADAGEASYRLYRGGLLELQTDRRSELFEYLMARLNLEAIDGFDGFASHAGVVSLSGDATAFPGASGEGKSSLVAAALLAGFEYVSDEALCVEFASRSLVPYPRPLGLSLSICDALCVTPSLRHPSESESTPAAKATVAPSALGAAMASVPLALAHIVSLRRHPNQTKATLVEMPRHEAAIWLLQRSFNHYKRPQESFGLAADLAAGSRAWCLEYDDLRSAASLIRARLGET